MRKILYGLLLLTLIQSCTTQKGETFWRSEYVKQIDGKPLILATSGYADMVADMQIHLSKNNDSLRLFYPFEKQLNVADFKSISNCRLANGNLLDSIYEVEEEKDSLRIKFYFNGREDKDRYVLTLSRVEKNKFLKETNKLKNDKIQLQETLKTVDASALNLSIPKPKYFNQDTNLGILNPIQLAEMLGGKDDALQSNTQISELETADNKKYQFIEYEILNSNKLKFSAVKIDNIDFNNIKYVVDVQNNKTDAIIISQNDLKKIDIQNLFNKIYAKADKVELKSEYEGLLEFSFFNNDKTELTKLIIGELPENLSKSQIQNNKTPLQVFEAYISTRPQADITITIVSKELLLLLKATDVKGDKPNVPFNF
ncbi:MAG: hypothetical protein ABIP95_10875 [Pelobium sp.]